MPLPGATAHLIFGLSLILASYLERLQPVAPVYRRLSVVYMALLLLTMGISLTYLVWYCWEARFQLEQLLTQRFFNISLPFLAALSFFLLSFSQLVYTCLGKRLNGPQLTFLVELPAIVVLYVGLFAIVGHLFHIPLLFNFKIPFLGAIAFSLAGVAVLFRTLPQRGLLLPLFSGHIPTRWLAYSALGLSLLILGNAIHNVVQYAVLIRYTVSSAEVTAQSLQASFAVSTCTQILLAVLVKMMGLRAALFFNDSLFHSQQELEAKDRYRRIVEGSNDGIWDWDLLNQTCYWNDRFYDILGLSPDEVPSPEKGFELIHADDRQRVQDAIEAHLRDGTKYDLQIRMRHSSGEYRHLHARAQAIYNAQGKPVRLAGVVTDITEHIRYQQALRESEQRFRYMAESTPIMLWMTNESGDLIYVNQAQQEFLPGPWETIQGQNWIENIHPDDREAYVTLFYEASKARQPLKTEVRVRHCSGDFRWLMVAASPRYLPDGAYQGFIGSTVDITDQKLALQRVQESESRFRRVVDSSIIGVVFWNRYPGAITDANDAFLRMVGYTREELQAGQVNWRGMTPPEFQELDEDAFAQMAISGTCRPYEKQYFHKDGHRVDIMLGVAYLEGADNEGVAFIADITERKRSEQALQESEAQVRKLNEVLEQRVAERTAELAALNKELESFCYSISHDLRAPLRSIEGFSQIVLSQYAPQLDGRGEEYLRRVRDNAQKMSELIDSLLKLSRLTRMPVKRNSVNLSAMVAETLEALRQQEPDRQIQIRVEPGLHVRGDKLLLQAMVQNLVDNAWKYTSRENCAEIEFGLLEKDGRSVYYVKDNGAGFDMAYVNKLFTPFQRLHSSEDFPGHGIGLATVQRIIRRHGGEVWAEATENQGAVFYFTLEPAEPAVTQIPKKDVLHA